MPASLFAVLLGTASLLAYRALAPSRFARAAHHGRAFDILSDGSSWWIGLIHAGLAVGALTIVANAQDQAFRVVAMAFAAYGAMMAVAEIARRARAARSLR